MKSPFHSFRHTFSDELKQLGAEQKKIEALTWHKESSMAGGRYGKSYKVDVLHPVICLLEFAMRNCSCSELTLPSQVRSNLYRGSVNFSGGRISMSFTLPTSMPDRKYYQPEATLKMERFF